MSFQIAGKLHKKFDTEQKTATFQAREFILEVNDGQYPQVVKFQLTQDRCAMIDDYAEGDTLTVHFDLRGREWNGKYFTNLNAWRIEGAGATAESGAGTSSTDADPPPREAGDPVFDDDIPFARPAALDGLVFHYDGAWFGNGRSNPRR